VPWDPVSENKETLIRRRSSWMNRDLLDSPPFKLVGTELNTLAPAKEMATSGCEDLAQFAR